MSQSTVKQNILCVMIYWTKILHALDFDYYAVKADRFRLKTDYQ